MNHDEFKAARLSLGLTQQALADLFGRDIASIQRWEADSTLKSSVAVPSWAVREVNGMIEESKTNAS